LPIGFVASFVWSFSWFSSQGREESKQCRSGERRGASGVEAKGTKGLPNQHVGGTRDGESSTDERWVRGRNARAALPLFVEGGNSGCGLGPAAAWIRLGFVLILSRSGMVWSGAPGWGPWVPADASSRAAAASAQMPRTPKLQGCGWPGLFAAVRRALQAQVASPRPSSESPPISRPVQKLGFRCVLCVRSNRTMLCLG
jgi:hypothetical protein